VTTFNVITGIVTLASFAWALWQAYRNRRNEVAESAKATMELERIRQSASDVMAAAQTVNMVVQRAKESDVTTAELANLARVARGQLLIIANTLSQEEERLSQWEYGQIFESLSPSVAPLPQEADGPAQGEELTPEP